MTMTTLAHFNLELDCVDRFDLQRWWIARRIVKQQRVSRGGRGIDADSERVESISVAVKDPTNNT
jgi:hypothetical protein